MIFVGWIVFFIRFFIINPFNVVGMSMYPTIHDKDFILVDKISQRLSDYKRWDIIVFVPPGKTDPYVKRIIWLSWETVTIKDNTVKICKTDTEDCQMLDQGFLPTDSITKADCGKDTFKITDGFFVMGDNRWWSTDSRCCFGLQCFEHTNYQVPKNYIIGKVFLRLFPDFWTFTNPFIQ
jgi:signal peptidase I